SSRPRKRQFKPLEPICPGHSIAQARPVWSLFNPVSDQSLRPPHFSQFPVTSHPPSSPHPSPHLQLSLSNRHTHQRLYFTFLNCLFTSLWSPGRLRPRLSLPPSPTRSEFPSFTRIRGA
ncbi:unnamed protein product, partial [Protopolystoma xenopodis]